MGCFDTVMVPCPKCGKMAEFQSKGGDCAMRVYGLNDAPADVLQDVNRHGAHVCRCGVVFKVRVRTTAEAERVD